MYLFCFIQKYEPIIKLPILIFHKALVKNYQVTTYKFRSIEFEHNLK